MKFHQNRFHQHIAAFLFCCALLLSASHAYALVDNGDLVSVSITNGTPMMPRTVFTQTWTMTNTGTSTWTATYNGCTMNIIGNDSLGAVPLFAKTSSSSKHPSAIINSGKSIAPGGVATYSMSFIAPEAPGTYTDTFRV